MVEITKNISNLIENQFPSLYQSDGKNLIAFMEAYYEWMEQNENPLNRSRSLFSYSDIDQTLEEFILYFKNTYLSGIQFDTLSDKRLTVKKIIDLYRAKGNERALKLLFQLVYKEDIDLYFPGDDIFKPSDGIWIKPVYLEVSPSDRNKEFLGKQVRGLDSGATAFVDHIVRRKIGSKFVEIFYITNIVKDFIAGERLAYNNDYNNIPYVLGSLSDLLVDVPGYNFSIGDIVNLSSIHGNFGLGRVTEINDVTGAVKFTLNNIPSGWGYDANSEVLISETVVGFSNIQLASNTLPFIKEFDTVTLNVPANNAANVTANAFAFSSNNVGLINLSGSLGNTHTKIYTPNGNATITLISTGTDANVIISSVNPTETVVLFTDFIADQNIDTPQEYYVDLPLNSSQFYFPKLPAANVDSDPLINILDYDIKSLGEVDAILTINPGEDYNFAPYVKLYERPVASKRKQDYIIEFDTLTGRFEEGEIVTELVPIQGNVVSLTVDHFANTFQYYELIYQDNGVSNTATGGVLTISGNTVQINVFSGTFVTSNTIHGLSSNGTANTITVTTSGLTGEAIGRVISANTSVMSVKRLSLLHNFEANSPNLIIGDLSGATANVTFVDPDLTSLYSGENANVTTQVFAGTGAVKTLAIQDSGFGYINDELITFTSQNGLVSGTAKVSANKQGKGQGYYASTKGFSSSDKYIQDGTYYQTFSYEIRASLNLDRYADMVRDVVHVAGTRMFGKIIKKSTINTNARINNDDTGPIIG